MDSMTSNEFHERIKFGLDLAYRRMLKEKAMNDEDIIVTNDDGVIVRIPAKQALSELPPLPDPPECLKDLDYSGY